MKALRSRQFLCNYNVQARKSCNSRFLNESVDLLLLDSPDFIVLEKSCMVINNLNRPKSLRLIKTGYGTARLLFEVAVKFSVTQIVIAYAKQ